MRIKNRGALPLLQKLFSFNQNRENIISNLDREERNEIHKLMHVSKRKLFYAGVKFTRNYFICIIMSLNNQSDTTDLFAYI